MIRLFSIANGVPGTIQTLKVMVRVAREGSHLPEVRALAVQISPIDYEELLRKFWRYAEEMDETISPIDVQVRSLKSAGVMIGDCDDAATVTAAVALAARVPVRFVAVRRRSDGQFTHVFDEVAIENAGARTAWLRVDPTAPLDANYAGWERLVQEV